jgi:hypothetical protein
MTTKYSLVVDDLGSISQIASFNGHDLPEDQVEISANQYEKIFSNISGYFIKDGEVVIRPTQAVLLNKLLLTADGTDSIKITGATSGSIMKVEGLLLDNTAEGICENPDTFSTEIPDTYTLTISCFPYLDFTATIEAI